MVAQLVRRAFSSRSAIRAPPAPSSATLSRASSLPHSSVVRGRVAMMPRTPSESAQQLPGTSSNVSTAANAGTVRMESQEEIIRVGSVSSHRDASTVSRMAEDL
ncbi:hypothetical protein ACQY0O_006286 [Thecaphora frezii]|nr:hypothetical protein [Thecaphora frezii]